MATGKAKMMRKMEAAVAALLTAPTIAIAAQAVGISEQTLWRWLQDPGFQEMYKAAKARAVGQAIARLQQISGEAVEALRGIMVDGENPASSRVSAAKTILEMAVKGVELEDLAGRVRALEQQLSKQKEELPNGKFGKAHRKT